ncbi:MAG: hypothetical protein JRI68_00300 [Deltaproteobacteria bacterium]|nr:hypothetical protein [Deltaproteobacteria bacterium]
MNKTPDRSAPMSLERFEDLLDVYGASPDRWPADERDGGLALLADDAHAQQLVATAQALDDLLDAAPSEEPSAALRSRVLAAAPERPLTWRARLDQFTAQLWPFTPRWQPATGLAAAALLGIVVGTAVPETAAASEPVDVAELAFGSETDWQSAEESELP